MSTSGKFDAIEQLIQDEGLRIESLSVHQTELHVILNTGATLHFPISIFRSLATAEKAAVNDYRIIAGGTGVHWPAFDEDLSLKGFLQESLKQTIRNAAA